MELYTKLAKAISELPAMKKDTKGFNYKYFDINQLLDEVQPVFEANGLLLLQPLTHIDGKPAIKTIVIDIESGDKLEDIFPIGDDLDPQKQGSRITYYRRYSIQSLAGMRAEDDDGVSATQSKDTKKLTSTAPSPKTSPQGQNKPYTGTVAEQLSAKLTEIGVSTDKQAEYLEKNFSKEYDAKAWGYILADLNDPIKSKKRANDTEFSKDL